MTTAQKAIKVLALCLAGFIIINIINAVFFGIRIAANLDLNTKDKTMSFVKEYQNIQKIDIDSSSANIVIQTGDTFKVEAQDVESFDAKEKNGTLKIREKRGRLWSSHASGKINIYLPHQHNINTLKIESGASNIQMKDITAQKLDVNQGAGRLVIKNANFQKTNIDGGAGEIKVTESILNHLDLDTGVGKVDIEASITGKSKIECGVGEIVLSLIGTKEDYQILAEKGLGNIYIHDTEYKNDTIYGTGDNQIKLEGGIGNIKIDFVVPSLSQ